MRTCTATRSARARRQNHSGTATPAGFEGKEGLSKQRFSIVGDGDSAGLADPKRRFGPVYCNECRERASRLARVARNALMNADFPRLLALLEKIGVDVESADRGEIDENSSVTIRTALDRRREGSAGPDTRDRIPSSGSSRTSRPIDPRYTATSAEPPPRDEVTSCGFCVQRVQRPEDQSPTRSLLPPPQI
jgi:hypothetical protein